MRIALGCEISTVIDTLPETVSVGAESFFADGIYFCGARRHRGSITVARSELGRGTFLGNHAVVPQGQEWPDGLFVGVSTPADPVCLADAAPHFNRVVMAFLITPTVTFAAGAVMCFAIVILKWVLLGRARAGQHAFWSCWCGRWEFLFMAGGFWARGLLAVLEGTLLLNAFLRLTGVRIGRRVVLGAGFSQVVDPDMLIFDDDATVVCHFQAHSFEDRILKLDEIRIGAGASAGENAVIFYGAQLSQNARLAPHSVVMKRDQLDANTCYSGNPSRPG